MKLFFVSLIVLVFSVNANAEENNTELSFYSGIFDTIDDEGDDKSNLFGLEHKNTNLFRKLFGENISDHGSFLDRQELNVFVYRDPSRL